jgi:hypothetical protein
LLRNDDTSQKERKDKKHEKPDERKEKEEHKDDVETPHCVWENQFSDSDNSAQNIPYQY